MDFFKYSVLENHLLSALEYHLTMAVGVVWQVSNQSMVGMRMPSTQTFHLGSCIGAAPPSKSPWNRKKRHALCCYWCSIILILILILLFCCHPSCYSIIYPGNICKLHNIKKIGLGFIGTVPLWTVTIEISDHYNVH